MKKQSEKKEEYKIPKDQGKPKNFFWTYNLFLELILLLYGQKKLLDTQNQNRVKTQNSKQTFF